MSNSSFFPPGVFGPHDRSAWYSAELEAACEPSLWQQRASTSWRTARLLYLRAFHAPLMARLDRDASGQAIAHARTWRAERTRWDFDLSDEALLIDEPEAENLWQHLRHADFWNLCSCDEVEEHERDGADWVLEVLEGGRYHIVKRSLPHDTALRRACLLLLEMAGVQVQKIY